MMTLGDIIKMEFLKRETPKSILPLVWPPNSSVDISDDFLAVVSYDVVRFNA